MLDARQLSTLSDRGYVLVDGLFRKGEMEELTADLERYHLRMEQSLKSDHAGTKGISRANEIVFTDHIAERDPKVRAFCLRPELVSIAVSVLGPDIDLYWNQTVFKQPEARREFPWHQDDGYTQVSPSPYLTLWLALNDATPDNGCISVLPGWHKKGLLPHVWTNLGQLCHSNDDPDQGVLVPVSQGSIAAFYSLLPHKSGPNLSSGSRNAFVIQYAPMGLRRLPENEPFENLIPIARGGRPLVASAGQAA